jgi:predicted lipid carrier protein YhbT
MDPDTLFFRRRLAISGDTALALRLKNFLDTQTVSEHLPKQLLSLLYKLVAMAESV